MLFTGQVTVYTQLTKTHRKFELNFRDVVRVCTWVYYGSVKKEEIENIPIILGGMMF